MYFKISMANSYPFALLCLIDVILIIFLASITSITEYLKSSAHFKKFNRIAYAYRVD